MQSSTALHMLQAEKEGSIDGELVAKFSEELQLERENSSDSDDLPAHLRGLLDTNPFQLKDVEGEQEVTLTRNFGNETINVTFSISALSDLSSDPDDSAQDRAMYDIDDVPSDTKSGGAQSKNTINKGSTKGGNFNVAPEDSVAPADREELMDNERAKSFPVPMNITIEKEGVDGALAFDVIAHDGVIQISNVYHYLKKEWANAKTAEQNYAHKATYTGPPYGNLDENLQRLVEDYLRERGINTMLAKWVPEYVDFKEQREYMKWLGDVRSFIET